MAQVKYGTIVTELKGKVGGQVFQAGNSGFVLRNKNSRSGGISLFSSSAHNLLSRIASTWRTLTAEERLEWEAIVENWQFVNRFGDTYTGSGYQVFMAFNRNRIQHGAAIMTSPASPGAAVDPEAIQFEALNTTLTVTWDVNPGVTTVYSVYATRCYPGSRRQFSRPYYFMGIQSGATGDIDITEAWQARFGQQIVGMNIDVKVLSALETFPKYSYSYQVTAPVVVAP